MELTEKIAIVFDAEGNEINKIILSAETDPAEFEAVWDEEGNTALLAALVRKERDKRLVDDVDSIVTNPLRYNALTSTEQEELNAKRQALLDIPQQDGFPFDVIWP